MANSRVFVLVPLIIVTFLSVVWNESYLVKAEFDVITTEENTTEEENLMIECQNSDYRTYIKCLKYKGNKVKRHFPEISTEIDHECMDKCVKNCRTTTIPIHDCSSKCSHCIRRRKQKTQIITEYETECIEGDCDKKDDKPPVVGMANITTNMVINNVIRTDTDGTSDSTTKPPYPPTPSPPHPHFPSDCNCTCCDNCPPCPPWCCSHHYNHFGGFYGGLQLSLVPQLNLGLGLSPSFNCIYPYHWFCHHRYHYHNPIPSSGIDCSGCQYPVNQYRCHSSCYGYDSYGPRMKREKTPSTE
ncbi:PREDICTED: uncharacterized protein LOC107063802 isoform X2 [Polistes dominula]|uniref:Uncharacterized protein LOC107063802 isoform X2 n=1 Tax=Polistes dominula TaxID=743375 RepID=A0ABM1HTV8_POLDO|nr:PREDICTED: uncharacterized protein LOC107063802 isoform X2 [Polistes dominula]